MELALEMLRKFELYLQILKGDFVCGTTDAYTVNGNDFESSMFEELKSQGKDT